LWYSGRNFFIEKVIIMELNDTSDYQRCFACGLHNPFGLHMTFRVENNSVVSELVPKEEHQGFPGVIHGGIVATILDEVLNRTSMLTDAPAWSMTGRLELRYRSPVPYGPRLRARAWLEKQRGRMVQASGVLTLADDEQAVLAEAQGTFMVLTQETLDTLMKDYPAMRNLLSSSK
jgi:acyl-coenzyme A thioesterase PaaI-like protein